MPVAATELTLLSTVVAPSFTSARLVLTPVSTEHLPELLANVTRNLCGHPATDAVLRELCPTLPVSERAFWDGRTLGLAVRPRGGVRGADQNGDVTVTLNDLEAVVVEWDLDFLSGML